MRFRDHARAELRDAGDLFTRWFLRSLLPFTVPLAAALLIAVFDTPSKPRGGEGAFVILITVLMAAVGATVPSAAVGLFAVLLRLAGGWITFPLVLSPSMGALSLWLGWGLVVEGVNSIEFGSAGHGWVFAPVLLVALAIALLLALAFFVAGALVGFIIAAPPLAFGISRRLRARARARDAEIETSA